MEIVEPLPVLLTAAPSLVLIIWLIETFEAQLCLLGGTKVVVFKTSGSETTLVKEKLGNSYPLSLVMT